MKVLLLICIQVIILYQLSDTKLIRQNNNLQILQLKNNAFDKSKQFYRMLELYDQRQLRSISDLWESIKNTAVNTWNHIKNIANKTKEKIKEIIDHLKERIIEIQSKFEERLKELQDQVKEIIDKAISTGQNVKKCIDEEKAEIDNIAKEILKNVSSCVSENLLQLSHLERTFTIEFDETDFQNKLDSNLEACVQTGDIDEECLHGVREDLFSDVEAMENEVLQNGAQTRNVAEDILNAIISCTTKGLIVASSNITEEAIAILKCAADETENGTGPSYMKRV